MTSDLHKSYFCNFGAGQHTILSALFQSDNISQSQMAAFIRLGLRQHRACSAAAFVRTLGAEIYLGRTSLVLQQKSPPRQCLMRSMLTRNFHCTSSKLCIFSDQTESEHQPMSRADVKLKMAKMQHLPATFEEDVMNKMG